MADTTDIAKRMKDYERVSKTYLTKRTPVIVRVDGVAFHTFSKGMRRPFDDEILLEAMRQTMLTLCKWLPGCVFGYTQSDEITFVLTDYKTLSIGAFYDYVQDKLESIIASKTTLEFNKEFKKRVEIVFKDINTDESNLYRSRIGTALFDCRAFNVPKEDVQNNLYWRQFDASKNSIAQVAQFYFSHKELDKKSTSDQQDMLMTQKGINWNDYPTRLKRGTCCVRKKVIKEVYDTNAPVEEGKEREKKTRVTFPWILDIDCPIFTKDWTYITDRVYYQSDFANMD
jgi:tRNA(His) 5'-end guanylyltransferase